MAALGKTICFLGSSVYLVLLLISYQFIMLTKKDAQLYLGQNEDCGLGGSTSNSSEGLLQRGNQGRLIHKILLKQKFNTIKCLHYKRFICQSQGADVIMNGFNAILGMRRCKDWDHKICSWKYPNHLKTCPTRFPGAQRTLLPPEHPRGD